MCHSGFNSSSRSEEELFSSGQDPSSSGTLDPALSPPSLTPSDRNSERVVPECEDIQGEGQRYYVLTESSGSGSDESISGTPDPIFTSQGTLSSLFVSDLDKIRRRYDFPNGFSLAVPSEEAHIHRFGFITLYEDALIAGLQLLLHPLARDLLIYLGVTPGQGKIIISRCPTNNKGWKKKFFHISSLGFCEENLKGTPCPPFGRTS